MLNISHERTKETITVEYLNNNCGLSTQRTWLRRAAHSFVAMINIKPVVQIVIKVSPKITLVQLRSTRALFAEKLL